MAKSKRRDAANAIDIKEAIALIYQTNSELGKNFTFITVQKVFELSIILAGFLTLKRTIEDTFKNLEDAE